MNKNFSRLQLPLLARGMKAMPVVVVTGARQTGKTTLVRDLLDDPTRSYFTLDRLEILDQARSHPESLLKDPPVTLDEVQREPRLLIEIKRKVDENRKAGQFLLTGSANPALMHSVSESLAGRALYLELPGFCPVEWATHHPQALEPLDALFRPEFRSHDWPTTRGEWIPWLLRGGYPSVLSLGEPEDRDLWFSGYVQTYLERDLRDLARITDLGYFQRIMRLAAQRAGKLLNQSDLARDADLPQPTAHRYLNLMETGYQITRLPVYATHPATAIVKARKLLWNDCGLGAWLAGIASEDDLHRRSDEGHWLEQAVYQSLQTWKSLDPFKRRIHYWRDRQGHEVDFILEQSGKLVALEVKGAATVGPKDTAGLRAFREALGRKKGLVRSAMLYGGQEARTLGEDFLALPWGWMFPKAGK